MVYLTFLMENWTDILFFVLLMIVYTIIITLNNGVVNKTLNNSDKLVKTIVLERFKDKNNNKDPIGYMYKINKRSKKV